MPPVAVPVHPPEHQQPFIDSHPESYVDTPPLTGLLFHRPVDLIKEYWGRLVDCHSEYAVLLEFGGGEVVEQPRQLGVCISVLKHVLGAVGFAALTCFDVVYNL